MLMIVVVVEKGIDAGCLGDHRIAIVFGAEKGIGNDAGRIGHRAVAKGVRVVFSRPSTTGMMRVVVLDGLVGVGDHGVDGIVEKRRGPRRIRRRNEGGQHLILLLLMVLLLLLLARGCGGAGGVPRARRGRGGGGWMGF